jgi:predicted phosphodiesterase
VASLEDLAAASPDGQVPNASLPAGWAPSVTYDPSGRAEVVTLGAGQPGDESTWTDEVRALGVDIPPGWSARLVQISHDPKAWVRHGQGDDAVTEAVTRRKYVVEPARAASLDVDELLAAIPPKRPVRKAVQSGEAWAYVHTVADWQVGKTAYGEGTEQTVERILNSLDASLTRLKAEGKRRPIGTVVLASLGDLCEGTTSQGGAVHLTADLGLTEQLRVIRRLLLEHVKAFAGVAERVIVPTAPGNHDQAHRLMGITAPANDSFAVDASMQVADALQLAGGFDHVQIITPDIDDLTCTIEAEGTIIGCAHGHQFRGPDKAHAWWAKQGHARHRIGQAHLLLSGHYHHLRVVDDSGRTAIGCLTVDPGSPWFDQRSGGGPQHGVLTFLTRDGAWTGLEIL